jgi:hypothetical protein
MMMMMMMLNLNSNYCPQLRDFKFILPFKAGTEGLRKQGRYSVNIKYAK